MKKIRLAIVAVMAIVLIALVASLASILSSPRTISAPSETQPDYLDKRGDQELAYLLVKLELRTRTTIAQHYTRPQAVFPGTDLIYKGWLARNTILPAAVADQIFSGVVPGATGGRAWVKMVVEDPRNPHNHGDSTALEMLRQIQAGAPNAEDSSPEAYYNSEPIKANDS